MRLYLAGTKPNSMYKGQRLGRRLKWWAQRRLYGVDDTETWGLNLTMMQLLYERLRRYRKLAPKRIHLDQEVTIKGVTHTELEWIDIMLVLMMQVFKEDFDYDKDGMTFQSIRRIWYGTSGQNCI